MQQLTRYWGTDYDFGRIEARLNALPQFVTEIHGLDIHFIHIRSPHEGALPLIITHGWPGSVVEMLNVIGPLSDARHDSIRSVESADVEPLDADLHQLAAPGAARLPRRNRSDPMGRCHTRSLTTRCVASTDRARQAGERSVDEAKAKVT
jgi:Epoxide hydrolase N terminus